MGACAGNRSVPTLYWAPFGLGSRTVLSYMAPCTQFSRMRLRITIALWKQTGFCVRAQLEDNVLSFSVTEAGPGLASTRGNLVYAHKIVQTQHVKGMCQAAGPAGPLSRSAVWDLNTCFTRELSSAAYWMCDIRVYEFSQACWLLTTPSSHKRVLDSTYGPQNCTKLDWSS